MKVPSKKKLAIHQSDKVKFINLSEVVCFEASNNYTDIYTYETKKYNTSKVLKDYEDFLPESKNFIRLNKSVIINVNYIDHYSKGDPCIVYMKNKQKFEVSRRRKKEINDILQKLVLGKK